MKKSLLFLFILVLTSAKATHLLDVLVYHQQSYVQGPWRGSVNLEDDGAFLLPTVYRINLGSLKADLLQSILEQLSAQKPDLYLWNFEFTLADSTVVLHADVSELSPVAFNEILASFTQLNFCSQVTFVLQGDSETYTAQDITLPFFTLAQYQPETLDEIPVVEETPYTPEPNNGYGPLFLSLLLGLILGFLWGRNRRANQKNKPASRLRKE